MTYDELIQSIDEETSIVTEMFLQRNWVMEHAPELEEKSQTSKVIKEIARIAYEAAAKDMKAWYVLDKNGENVHIGDDVSEGEVIMLGLGHYTKSPSIIAAQCNATIEIPQELCEKGNHDSREKLIDELEYKIHEAADDAWYTEDFRELRREIAESFIDRAIALGGGE